MTSGKTINADFLLILLDYYMNNCDCMNDETINKGYTCDTCKLIILYKQLEYTDPKVTKDNVELLAKEVIEDMDRKELERHCKVELENSYYKDTELFKSDWSDKFSNI